ncbi:uncharacterized protein LOC115750849 isoform X2 [Rhodamnia argentea]|uniref:Uncharacterized protein LOC115750849 isoform X2 n=1 Tax=Rhodamnia argentea TaxID=178133 RepID=A0A8B8QCN0_9MYRT|nr:uncharacterized protein LOC115750849 isoform X2 [Rhodamnia argentea]XP_048137843.1 uncharacterized protein LOC115750849 isoform X2 [Rhodamnia argentea]
MQDLEDRLDLAELELDDPFEIAISQDARKVVTPGFHENHLSGRGLPKILARVIFSPGDDLRLNIAAEVPLGDTGIMTSSQPIRYMKNLMLMLVTWGERKWVSKGMHEYQRKDEQLLSLEFCDYCMCITSEVREFSDSPSLETSPRFPQLSIAVLISLFEPGRSDQIGCRVETLEILTQFSSQILRSTNLLLRIPWSSKKLPDYIGMLNSWHQEATQVQGPGSRRSFRNCTSRRLRKTRWGRLRAMGQRNLTWLCLHNYLDKRLLMYAVGVCFHCCILSPFMKTKPHYDYMFEEARSLLGRAPDVKQKTRLAWEFARAMKWFGEVIYREIPEEDFCQFWEDMYIPFLHWCRRNRRRGHHHHKTWDAGFWKLT